MYRHGTPGVLEPVQTFTSECCRRQRTQRPPRRTGSRCVGVEGTPKVNGPVWTSQSRPHSRESVPPDSGLRSMGSPPMGVPSRQVAGGERVGTGHSSPDPVWDTTHDSTQSTPRDGPRRTPSRQFTPPLCLDVSESLKDALPEEST